MKYDVFISYSSKDQKVAEGVCGFLESNGIRCFVAYRDIPPGVVWAAAIADGLEKSSMMVTIFSKDFNMSSQVDREIELAANDKKPILTFRISDDIMTGAKKYYLQNLNWLDAFPDPEKSFGALLENIKSLLGKPGQKVTPINENLVQQTITNDKGTYVGDVLNEKRNGHGVFTSNSGWIIEGTFVNDVFHGEGKVTSPDGDIYEGFFDKGKFTGKMKWSNGDVYEGKVVDSVMTGKYTISLSNGETYLVKFILGKMARINLKLSSKNIVAKIKLRSLYWILNNEL